MEGCDEAGKPSDMVDTSREHTVRWDRWTERNVTPPSHSHTHLPTTQEAAAGGTVNPRMTTDPEQPSSHEGMKGISLKATPTKLLFQAF